MNGYNGWKNRATWNIALWINNDYGLYTSAQEFATKYKAQHGDRTRGIYKAFVRHTGLEFEKTPDRFSYLSKNLDYQELDAMMLDL